MVRVTRDELEEQYNTNEINCITSPGKYEGEPLYVPYLWEQYGFGQGFETISTHTETVEVIKVYNDMIEEFPELEGVEYVSLSEDNQGFVHSEALESDDELEELEERAENLREEEEQIRDEAR
jgi:hypothetical protein